MEMGVLTGDSGRITRYMDMGNTLKERATGQENSLGIGNKECTRVKRVLKENRFLQNS